KKSTGNVSEPAKAAGSLPGMRLVEPVRVTVFETLVPSLLVAGSLLLEIFLSHHVQVSSGWQHCSVRGLLSRVQSDCISRALLRSSAMRGAMSVERCNSTHDERRQRHHHEKTRRFEFSGHDLALENHARFWLTTFYVECRQRIGERTL